MSAGEWAAQPAKESTSLASHCLAHSLSLRGFLQVNQCICSWTAIACAVLQTLWLTQAGGAWVVFSAAICLLRSFFNILVDGCKLRDKLPHWWPQAELFLTLVCILFCSISVAVSVMAAPLLYLAEVDGVMLLYDTRPINAVLAFSLLALLFYVAELVYLICSRLRGGD